MKKKTKQTPAIKRDVKKKESTKRVNKFDPFTVESIQIVAIVDNGRNRELFYTPSEGITLAEQILMLEEIISMLKNSTK